MLPQVNTQLIDANPKQEYESAADHVTVMVRLQGFLRPDGRILNFYTHNDVFAWAGGGVIYKLAPSLESTCSGTESFRLRRLRLDHNFSVGFQKNLRRPSRVALGNQAAPFHSANEVIGN